MKNIFLILCIFCSLMGCVDRQLNHRDTVMAYYEARDAVDFQKVMKYIQDSITIMEGDYIMPYSKESFHEVFKWDSIFQPSYQILEIAEKDNQAIATVGLQSIRNEFLKNSEMTCKYRISFTSGRISLIESLECENVDWNLWQKERDALVRWVKNEHPELDGFINDMTMKGAIHYVKAIELYNLDTGSF